jgi:hypothetical protein
MTTFDAVHDPERVAVGLAWLNVMPARAQLQRQGVGAVEDDRPQAWGWCHGGLLWAG